MESKRVLNRILADKGASRREFMVGATALGLSITAASAMWREAKAQEPKRGGHMRAGLNDANTIDSLDPATFNATYMISVSRAFRDSLVEVGQDNTAQPTLAESWESTPDALIWRFKLRPGVEFSNGKSLTTDDVIDSINVHRGPDTKSGAAGVFAGIEDVTADGKDVVVVTLKEANADFPFLMTDYHMNIMPSKDGKAEVLSDVGTGTYLLKEFEPGVRALLERNPNAWQSDFGFVDSCELTAILDDAARESALLTKDVQVINRPGLKTINRLAKVPHVNIIDVESNLAFTHPMRINVPPFDSLDFRKALKHAIPRKEFVDKILYGYGVEGNDQPLGPVFTNYEPSITVDYDLDKAKSYLKAAGMENAKIEMHTADTAYGGAVDAAVLFQEHFAKIGVELTVTREPKDGYWTDIWNKKPFCSCYWGARPVEDMILSICYLSDAPWNDTLINIPRVDELVKAARGELDPATRKGMYTEVQQLLSDDGATIIPAFGKDVAATSKEVGIGPNIGGGWEMDGGHFIKRWWLES
ncbi:MAG: ABC transporter substrate-binding protein [Pseudomonadota bacterium]